LDSNNNTQRCQRSWHAELNLDLALRSGRTVLVGNRHSGPLRVQRPFYPEPQDCCHVYLLHPPGGLVLGDSLCINVNLEHKGSALITTPSAGKLYNVKEAQEQQYQKTELKINTGATLEWMPQETIVFNGANAHLATHIHLQPGAKFFAWDVVCLGRPASDEQFEKGLCFQELQVWCDNRIKLCERNRFQGGEQLISAKWGLQDFHTSGILVASCTPTRNAVQSMLDTLNREFCSSGHWGLSQKSDLFIARYMGNGGIDCRRGLEYIWHQIRPILKGVEAITPRIWNT